MKNDRTDKGRRLEFLSSIRTRIFLVSLVIGLAPCLFLQRGILENYERRAVGVQTGQAQTQLRAIANHLILSDYMNDSQSDLIDAELAEKLCVSDKAVSKWENGRGFPDVSLLEPIGKVLHISVPELLCGQTITNRNRGSNMLKSLFYVCPVCGNVIFATGEAVISCCGIVLPPLTHEPADENHQIQTEFIEDEIYVSMNHPMTKTHSISFFATMSDQGLQIVKLYPEGSAEARFKRSRVSSLYACCNRHGLFRMMPSRTGKLPPMTAGKE